MVLANTSVFEKALHTATSLLYGFTLSYEIGKYRNQLPNPSIY